MVKHGIDNIYELNKTLDNIQGFENKND